MKSAQAQSLFAAAREDGPDEATRQAMFRKVAVASAMAAGASLSVPPVAAVVTKGAGLWGLKLLVLGTIIGAVGATLGLAFVFGSSVGEGATPQPQFRGVPANSRGVGGVGEGRGVTLSTSVARRRDTHDSSAAAVPKGPSASGDGRDGTLSKAIVVAGNESGLAEEATLVTAARNALLRGEPARALSLVRATAHLGTRALEPEEMGLEARALRALDRTDEAAVVELNLRKRYPGHALAR
jgi:hypothetical protein